MKSGHPVRGLTSIARTVAGLVVLIFLGEVLVVDPFGSMLERLGVSLEPEAAGWSVTAALAASAKRLTRTAYVVVAAWVVAWRSMGKSLREMGMIRGRGALMGLGLGMAFGFGIELVSVGLMATAGWFQVHGPVWQSAMPMAVAAGWAYGVAYSLEAAVLEEVLFRGVLFNLIEARFSVAAAVVATSVLFGLLHFGGFGAEFPWWVSILSATVCGLLFAQAYLLRRNLWLPVGIHFAWHLGARLLGSVGVGPDEALLLVTEVDGPAVMVSTRSGGAGVVELIGVATVSLVLWRLAHRSRHPVRRAD